MGINNRSINLRAADYEALAPYCRKIISTEELASTLQALRRRDLTGITPKSVVQCHGCFDIVHPGHIRYLQFARAQGDILVVSITGDAGIDKGELRPYIPQELRAENLAALEFVDYVVIDPHPTASDLLSMLRPDVYVKGQEYATSTDPRFLEEREIVESYGGRVIFSSGQVVFSSTRLVESIGQSSDLETQRLGALCRRHDIRTDSLDQIFAAMSHRRVLIVGDSFIERYVLCDAGQVAGEAPMMSLDELDSEDYLGGAAIAALQAASLGADAVLLTALGDDAGSSFVRHTLESLGVNVVAIPRRADLPIATRFMVDDRKLLKVQRGDAVPLDSLEERRAAEAVIDLSAHADLFIAYDGGYGLLTPSLASRISTASMTRKNFVAFGADQPRGNLTAIAGTDLICCSERALRAALHDSGAGLSPLAYQFMRTMQNRQMLVTLGKRGLVTFDRPSHDRNAPGWNDRLRSEHLPSFAQRAADRLGVGESVLATCALAMSAGASLMQAAYLSSGAAALALATAGTTPFTAQELIDWTISRNELNGTPPSTRIRNRKGTVHAAATV